MANVIKKTTNKFSRGLVLDFSPENTKNEVLTHALNATLLTFNGNELSLQNDMGNARVETAYLPEGYMPVGTCEYGGIIYIVSYNPLENKSLIGCFPSPERNISQEELGRNENVTLQWSDFQSHDENNDYPNGTLNLVSSKVLLRESNLNPGDKFIVYANETILNEKLLDLTLNDNLIHNPVIALNVVSIEDSGKIVYLNSDIRKYKVTTGDGEYNYHILGSNKGITSSRNDDVDTYRNALSSGYSVFKEKTSGKLAILAELVMIDSYSVTHRIEPITDQYGNNSTGNFQITINTDVSPQLTVGNYDIAPKLRYYYLQNSQGKLQCFGLDDIHLFTEDGSINSNFTSLLLKQLINEESYNGSFDLSNTLGESGNYGFNKPKTYHGRLEDFTGELFEQAYAQLEANEFYRIDKYQVYKNTNDGLVFDSLYYTNELRAKFYKYMPEGVESRFTIDMTYNETYVYEIEESLNVYHNACRDILYQNLDLYKQISVLSIASSEIISNKKIEKFALVESFIYKKIEDNSKRPEGTVYIKTESGYDSYQLELQDGVDYYTMEIVYKTVSYGFDLDPATVTGNLYYYAASNIYEEASADDLLKYWDFTTYPKLDASDSEPYYGCDLILYRKKVIKERKTATSEAEITEALTQQKTVYYQTDYELVTNINDYSSYEECENEEDYHQLFITLPETTLLTPNKFRPDKDKNKLKGQKPDSKDIHEPAEGFPRDSEMTLKTFAQFIPTQSERIYPDIKLAEIQIPEVFIESNLDFPLKYDYTIVPCMGYGKIYHLAVSNTIDFNNLRNFEKSDFTTWKYRIDGSLLMLTFGASVYDTFETDKVSSLFLEFYDWRGFAGSLEITGKKSYSGKFTKILNLNTLNTLSTKKADTNNGVFIETYNHNANILKSTDESTGEIKFTLDGVEVLYDSRLGWRYVSGESSELEEANDCGVLYSNMIYGIKPYLVIQTEKGLKFIKKSDLFLFTMPIYNEYYYTVDNFKRLLNPKVNLLLTYRLEDFSDIKPYNNDSVENGYVKNDPNKSNIDLYLSGKYDNETHSLDVRRYFLYEGHTHLQLEVGLMQEYQEYNLSCDKTINNLFSCDLELSDDSGDKTFELKHKETSDDVLKHEPYVTETDHYLGFDGKAKTKSITSGFNEYNFLFSNGGNYIDISYNFIVGYDAYVRDIKKKTVLATSVCALYHSNDGGKTYNNSDFGIRLVENGDKGYVYLSDAMLFNSGSESEQLFGLCRMADINGVTMADQCISYRLYSGVVKPINIAGKLNAGDPLKEIVDSIGKLAFCLPHAHGLFASNVTNIHSIEGAKKNYIGVQPSLLLLQDPVYNMCVNTQNSINNASEFISSTLYGTHYVEPYTRTAYYGLNAKEIAKFNRCMLNTMKGVYAYNPDYDDFPVNMGDVSVEDYELQFTSNLLSSNASIGEADFNNYLKLGAIKIKEYLLDLSTHSEIPVQYTTVENDKKVKKWILNINFEPDFTYCGVDSDNKYLVSSLTYNIPVPQKLYDDLSLDFSEHVVVKHHDGEFDFIKGNLIKKQLYGWYAPSKKLVALDVLNYTINQNDGTLTILKNGKYDMTLKSLDIVLSEEEANAVMNTGSGTITVSRNLDDGTVMEFKLSVYTPGGMGITRLGCEKSFNPNYYEDHYGDERYYYNLWLYAHFDLDYGTSETNCDVYYTVSLLPVDTTQAVYIEKSDLDIEAVALYRSNFGTDDRWAYNQLTASSFLDITKDRKIEGSYGSYGLVYYYRDMFQDENSSGTSLNRVPLTYKYGTEEGELMVYENNWSKYYYTNKTNSKAELSLDIVDEDYHAIVRYKVPTFTVKILYFKSLDDYEENILNFPKTMDYYSFSSSGLYIVTPKVEGYNATLAGCSLTINDLLYYPELDGHRLFVRNSAFLSASSRGPIMYRVNGSSNLDTSLNALRTYTGPCYHENILIKESDPEYDTSSIII